MAVADAAFVEEGRPALREVVGFARFKRSVLVVVRKSRRGAVAVRPNKLEQRLTSCSTWSGKFSDCPHAYLGLFFSPVTSAYEKPHLIRPVIS